MKLLKEKVCIILDNDILAKIRKRAERDDMSVSSYINLILRKYIEATEKNK